MNTPVRFLDKVKSAITDLNTIETSDVDLGLQEETERLTNRARITQLIDARRRADENFVGDSPEEILGTDAAIICGEFLELMKAHNYPSSYRLADPTRSTPMNKGFVDAYKIGYTYPPNTGIASEIGSEANPKKSITIDGNWASVYLCADGMVRCEGISSLSGATGIPFDSTTGERYNLTISNNLIGSTSYSGSEDDRRWSPSYTETIIETSLETLLVDLAARAITPNLK
jgi:hypothetical protein